MHRLPSTALAHVERTDLVGRRRGRHPGATNVLQLASAGIVADVHITRVDRRTARSWYALELGAGASEATARLLGRLRGGGVEELGSIVTPPGCVGSASFPVTTPRTGAYESLVLEIRSGDMLLHVDAPQPPPLRARAPAAGAILAVAGLVILAGALAPFVLGGAANRTGAAPATAAMPTPHEVTVVPPPAARHAEAARVQTFSARRDQLPDGRETIVASYLAVGERGTVTLLDGDGTVVTSVPFTHAGTVQLAVPRAYRALPLTAMLTVRGGEAKAASSVVVAANAPASSAPATPAPSPSSAAGASTDSAQSGNTALLGIEGRAVAGKPLHLRFTSHQSPMRIELVDEAGATIATTQVAAGRTRAALPLPAAPERTTYRIAAYYPRGGGEEMLTRTVVALPH